MRKGEWEWVGRSRASGRCGSERAQAPGGAPMARNVYVYWLAHVTEGRSVKVPLGLNRREGELDGLEIVRQRGSIEM